MCDVVVRPVWRLSTVQDGPIEIGVWGTHRHPGRLYDFYFVGEGNYLLITYLIRSLA